MNILEELAQEPGQPEAQAALIDRCLDTPALMHTLAEGLRTGTQQVRQLCAELLVAVGQRRPDLLADFATDLLEATRQPGARIAKSAYEGLLLVAPLQSAALFAERDSLLEAARAGGASGVAALKLLAALCSHGPNYRGKLLPPTLRLLQGLSDRDLARWVAVLEPAVAGSEDSIKRLQRELEPRLAALTPEQRKKLDRTLARMARPPKKARAAAAARQ